MPPEPKRPALERTLPIYGDVKRALLAFESSCQEYLLERRDSVAALLRAGGLEVSEIRGKSKADQSEYAYLCSVRWSLDRLHQLQDPEASYLVLYLGWRLEPGSDEQAAPFACIEIDHSGVKDREAWKRFMGLVRDLLPKGIGWERSINAFEVMRDDTEPSTYRQRLEDLSSDFELLARALASALKGVSERKSKGR